MFGSRLIGSRVKATQPNTTSAMAHIATVTRRFSENSMRLMGPPASAADRPIGGAAEIGGLGGGDDLDRRALLQPALAGDDHLLSRLDTRERLDAGPFLETKGGGALLRHARAGGEDIGVLQLADHRLARQKHGLRMGLAHDVDGDEGAGTNLRRRRRRLDRELDGAGRRVDHRADLADAAVEARLLARLHGDPDL